MDVYEISDTILPEKFGNLSQAADEKCTLKYSSTELIGRKVRIWWSQQKKFFRGTIKYFNSDQGMHMVEYDMGFKELVDLSEGRWLLEQEPDSVSGASNTIKDARLSNELSKLSYIKFASLKEFFGIFTLKRVKSARISSSDNSKRKHVDAACQDLMTEKDKKQKATNKESNSHDGQAICWKTAAAAADSKIICGSSKKTPAHPPGFSLKDGNADASTELANVGGYLVKDSLAPILGSIFSKYGDIASNCLFKQHHTMIHFLEIVCNVVRRLQSADGLSNSEVRELISEISDAAEAKLDVSWLQKFLEQEINHGEHMELRAKSNLIVKAARKDMEEAKSRWEALELFNTKIERDAVQNWRKRVDELLARDHTF